MIDVLKINSKNLRSRFGGKIKLGQKLNITSFEPITSQTSEAIIFEFSDPKLVNRPSLSQILESREYP